MKLEEVKRRLEEIKNKGFVKTALSKKPLSVKIDNHD
jgi:hypothetical protein